MKFRVTLAVLLPCLFTVSLFAATWDSPVDARYRQRDAALFVQYLQAQQLIDGAGGRTERLKHAETILNGILQVDPDFAPAYFELARQIIKSGYLGKSRFREGTLDRAEQAIRKALSVEPEYADAYSLLGHVYTLDGQFAAAEEALTRAETIGSGSPWLAMNWADLLAKQGRREEANDRYLEVLASGTDDQGILNTARREVKRYYDAQAQAARDPVKIWNAAVAQQDQTLRFHMMREALSLWADTNPFQAIEYVDRLPPGQERSSFHAMALTNAASVRPVEMLERLDSFPNAQDQRNILGQAMRALGETEGAGAVQRAENFYSIDRKKMALQSAYRGWAEVDILAAANHFAREQKLADYPAVGQAILDAYLRKDEPGALQWAEQVDGLGGHVLWSRALLPMAANRPEDALVILAEVPANPETERGVRSVLETIADTRPEMALAFVEQLPVAALRGQVTQRAVMQWAESDPLSAFEWTTTQPPAIQASVYPRLVPRLAQADLPFVLGIPLDSLPHEARENWVSSVFNEYSKQDPVGAENWLRQFADHPMYDTWQTQAAYRLAQQDPQAALDSLARLESSPRTLTAVDSVIGVWARSDPAAAANWVITQYPGDDNTRAIQSLTGAWSRMDYTGAKRWALGLPGVRERDAAISTLYQVQSTNDPGSAEAEDLLRLITDEAVAFNALRTGILNLAMRDRAAALEYVRTVNVTEDERRQILDALERPVGRN